KLRDEFLDGYYGAAGPDLGQYLDLVNACSNDPGMPVGCGSNDVSYLSDAAIVRANELFDHAEKVAASNADQLSRVRRERLALPHVGLLRYDFSNSQAGANDPQSARQVGAAAKA